MSDNKMTLEDWERATEGTYPGYSTNTGEGFEIESRAYASLTEVIDESEPTDWQGVMVDRRIGYLAQGDEVESYEPDHRIADIAGLLLTHGWRPPEYLAYTPIALNSWGGERGGGTESRPLFPVEEEQLDLGAAMAELARESLSPGYNGFHDSHHEEQ